MKTATIHITTSAENKNHWVRAAQRDGKKLGDWITEIIEAHIRKKAVSLAIPEGVSFADLKLSRDADGFVSFDWQPIETICTANKMPVGLLRNNEDNACGLIVKWYAAHLAAGGERDAVADDLIAETLAEDAAGQCVSHAPGRA